MKEDHLIIEEKIIIISGRGSGREVGNLERERERVGGMDRVGFMGVAGTSGRQWQT